MCPEKTAEPFEMLFGLWSPKELYIRWGPGSPTGRNTYLLEEGLHDSFNV